MTTAAIYLHKFYSCHCQSTCNMTCECCTSREHVVIIQTQLVSMLRLFPNFDCSKMTFALSLIPFHAILFVINMSHAFSTIRTKISTTNSRSQPLRSRLWLNRPLTRFYRDNCTSYKSVRSQNNMDAVDEGRLSDGHSAVVAWLSPHRIPL